MDLVLRILSWLFRVHRSLQMAEFLEASAMEEFVSDDDLHNIHAETLPPSEVVECCKSLVGV